MVLRGAREGQTQQNFRVSWWGENAGKGEKLGQMQAPLLWAWQKRVKRSH